MGAGTVGNRSADVLLSLGIPVVLCKYDANPEDIKTRELHALIERWGNTEIGKGIRTYAARGSNSDERAANIEKQGDTLYRIEPEVREGPGGLRDIHLAEWLAAASFPSTRGDVMVECPDRRGRSRTVELPRNAGEAVVAMAGIAGVMMATEFNSGKAIWGVGLELDVIAAVVVGGTSLMGGQGRIFGTLIGCAIIVVIRNGMNLLSLEDSMQMMVMGGVIVLLPLAVAHFFGLAAFAVIMGTVSLILALGNASGALLSGVIYDALGSYDYAMLLYMFLYLIATVSIFLAGKPLRYPGGSAGAGH